TSMSTVCLLFCEAGLFISEISFLLIPLFRKCFIMVQKFYCFVLLGLMSLISFPLYTQQPLRIVVDPAAIRQTIDNIGASGCWFSEGIGRYWHKSQKDSIAQYLFSRELDKSGRLQGIGLSAWRFNIGGGTTEQGEKSGIKTYVKRVEGFLGPDGTYDWNKQSGYQWFLEKAREYGVEDLIAFSNTPPVNFTKNGLGFKTEKNYITNLRDDKYTDYAEFLANVIRHFDSKGIHFNYISPVNEPQWDWSNKMGEMNQEGSPWHNKDIYRIVRLLDSTLQKNKMSTKIIMPEAATLRHLYDEGGQAGRQIQHFFNRQSPYDVTTLPSVKQVVAGHSYFTDAGDSNRVSVRQRLKDTTDLYKVPFWQSEYSMLGDGFREQKKGKIPAMDCALFLAKVIHTDLVVANAAAWQLWNVYEPGDADFNTRYYVIALRSNDSNTAGSFRVTKNLWALGHYSRFIRPGMQRLDISRSDKSDHVEASSNLMVSAFKDKKGRYVMVLINYTDKPLTVDCTIGKKKSRGATLYTTTAADDMNMQPTVPPDLHKLSLAARSI
ncbi:MAG: beta-glycosidase, partial [Chitinophagaceae bacterium]